MIRLNLPVAVFTIVARRFIDYCRQQHLTTVLMHGPNQITIHGGSRPYLMFCFAMGIYMAFKRLQSQFVHSVSRTASYNITYSPKRLVKKCNSTRSDSGNSSRYYSASGSDRSVPRNKTFTLPLAIKKLPSIDPNHKQHSNNKKPVMKTSNQSTMITESLTTFLKSHEGGSPDFKVPQLPLRGSQTKDKPRLKPIANLNNNCIDLVSEDGDGDTTKLTNSDNSLESSILQDNPEEESKVTTTTSAAMAKDEMDKMIKQLTKELERKTCSLSETKFDGGSKGGDSDVSTINSDTSMESFFNKTNVEKKTRTRKRRKVVSKRTSKKKLNLLAIRKTRSGRIYNNGYDDNKKNRSSKRGKNY